MNRGEKIKILARQWAAKIGPEKAKVEMAKILDEKGEPVIGFSTADKLARGKYEPTPGHNITDALIELMARDGFSLADEKAS